MKSIKPNTLVYITLILLFLVSGLFYQLGGSSWLVQTKKEDKIITVSQQGTVEKKESKSKQAFVVPSLDAIPDDHLGKSIQRGKHYLENTFESLPKFVGAKMNCTNCHLNSGMTQFAGPWIGVTARFPQYRSRSAKVDTLTDRVNDCFERSLNGKRLPENGEPMTDIISYMTWLSKGYEIGGDIEGSGMPKLKIEQKPDLEKGKIVYQNKCSMCHQQNGQGLFAENGKVIYPALWGKDSFNVGAGMARLHTAAGFVKKNMPLGQGGTLTDEESWNVAAYFTTQTRPDFKKKLNDWIKGDKPSDARY